MAAGAEGDSLARIRGIGPAREVLALEPRHVDQ
jgi:predicted flap endonuclease-1-like 5' DNA nuclease